MEGDVSFMRHIPFSNCQNCHGQPAGGACVSVNSEMWPLCGLDVVSRPSNSSAWPKLGGSVLTWEEGPAMPETVHSATPAKRACGPEALMLRRLAAWRSQTGSLQGSHSTPLKPEHVDTAGPWSEPTM